MHGIVLAGTSQTGLRGWHNVRGSASRLLSDNMKEHCKNGNSVCNILQWPQQEYDVQFLWV